MSARSVDVPSWLEPLETDLAAERGELRAALLTTFDPPEPALLIEDLLPTWLGMDRELVDSGPDRATFLMDLQSRLKRLRGRIAIFCSSRPEEDSGHWLWRDVRRFPVGSARRAVQHAKLWLFHREPGGDLDTGSLEIVVGSTNLTRSALRDQVQAGWRAILPLGKASASNRESWGPLPAFLRALGLQSCELGSEVTRYWTESVLPRVRAPDVSFVASVPGRHGTATLRNRRTAWGLAGLRAMRPVSPRREIDIVAPTVGAFDRTMLKEWADDAGSCLGGLRLAWIAKDGPGELPHPWVGRGWVMPAATRKALSDGRVSLREFPRALDACHRDASPEDSRWMHGKLYWVRDGRKLRLLVTSANWSQAAWGRRARGHVVIENFELGVAFETGWRPQERWDTLVPGQLYTTVPIADRREPNLAWAMASWNGTAVRVELRLASRAASLAVARVEVTAVDSRARAMKARWSMRVGVHREGRIQWPLARGAPVALRIQLGSAAAPVFTLPVADVRPLRASEPESFAEVSAADADVLELKLLEERYGGPPADEGWHVSETSPDEEGSEVPDGLQGTLDDLGEDLGGPVADYAVPAILHARALLEIVTQWAVALAASTQSGKSTAECVIEDGRRLAALWEKRIASLAGVERVALGVALDELRARLGRFR